MGEAAETASVEGAEETVLRHLERIDIAIASLVLLAVMVKLLISFVREQNISVYVALITVALWLTGFIAILCVLIWSTIVCTVVCRGPERLSVYFAIGRLVRRAVRSILLDDLKDVVAQERLYGVKGRKARRYEIVFGPARERSELLARPTRAHIEALLNGALRGILRIEHSS